MNLNKFGCWLTFHDWVSPDIWDDKRICIRCGKKERPEHDEKQKEKQRQNKAIKMWG